MTDQQFPLEVGDLISILATRGYLHHLSLASTTDGNWQASVKRPGSSKYSLSIKPDPVAALLSALEPVGKETWADVLGAEFAELFEGEEPEDIL